MKFLKIPMLVHIIMVYMHMIYICYTFQHFVDEDVSSTTKTACRLEAVTEVIRRSGNSTHNGTEGSVYENLSNFIFEDLCPQVRIANCQFQTIPQ